MIPAQCLQRDHRLTTRKLTKLIFVGFFVLNAVQKSVSLEDYFKHKGVVDIPLDNLNHQFITNYEFFLKSVRNMDHNTAMGTIKKLKKIVRIYVANESIDKDPFMSFKVMIRETNRP